MKRCLGLIAALGLATVASAANITWSGTNVTGSREIFGSGAEKTDFSLAVKITTNFAGKEIAQNAGMVTFGTSSRDNEAVGLLAYSNENGFGAHFDCATNGTTWTSNASALASGTHIVVLTGDWDATNNRWAVTLYIDGTTAVTFNGNGNPVVGLTDGALTAAFGSNAAWTFDEAATYDGTLTTEEIAQLVNGAEPTALALLALGVAGVALRRRVA